MEVNSSHGEEVDVDIPSRVITAKQLPIDPLTLLNEHVLTPSTLPPPLISTANPPPPREEEHEVNVGELNVKVHPLSTLTYTPPPYPPLVMHRVNVMDGRVNEEESEVNSHMLPFPLTRVVFSNVVPEKLNVFASDLPVRVIEMSGRDVSVIFTNELSVEVNLPLPTLTIDPALSIDDEPPDIVTFTMLILPSLELMTKKE